MRKIKEKFNLLRDYLLIKKSDLFDKNWYQKEYKDVAEAKIDPILHYILYGWKEKRNPSPFFNTEDYLKANPDVQKRDYNPIIHYLRYGKKEMRNPTKLQQNEEILLSENNFNFKLSTKILENWLISTEQHYGGLIKVSQRRKISPFDPRTPEILARTSMQGGDRMSFHGYAEKYAEFLIPFILKNCLEECPITVVEIGILKGSGLAIWGDLFPDGRIIGLDIDLSYTLDNLEYLKQFGAFKKSHLELYEFDQYQNNSENIGNIFNKSKIDICIDDGVHTDKAILNSLNIFLPFMADNFVYFIEDNQQVYQIIRKEYPNLIVANFGELTIITRNFEIPDNMINQNPDQFLSDIDWTKKAFLEEFGYPLNLKNPKTFNEKINVYKLFYRDKPLWKYADKYLVRKYVEKKIGSQYLIPIIGVYDNPDDINFSELPDQFALKMNHGSGWNIICFDKNKLDWEKSKKQIIEWKSTNYHTVWREWAYKDIQPKIIIEKFIVDTEMNIPKDYKFFCFSGKPMIIQIDNDRYENHTRNFYTPEWEELPFTKGIPKSINKINKPAKLDEMIEVASKLSEGFPFVRIDLFAIPDIFFGEMTFYPGAGLSKFSPDSWDLKIGNYWR